MLVLFVQSVTICFLHWWFSLPAISYCEGTYISMAAQIFWNFWTRGNVYIGVQLSRDRGMEQIAQQTSCGSWCVYCKHMAKHCYLDDMHTTKWVGGVSPCDLCDDWKLGATFDVGHPQGELVTMQAGLHTPLVGHALRGGAGWDSHTQPHTHAQPHH